MSEVIDSFQGEYRFLSNFFPREVKYHGVVWPSSEHLYQALKTLDLEKREEIRQATVGKAKRLGKKVEMRPNWDDDKDQIMYDVVWLKFSQNPELAQKLIDTGDAELIEGNWWGDVHWGVCKGKGLNRLGEILQDVRSRLMSSSKVS